MDKINIFIIIICICLFIIVYKYKYEKFVSNIENDINLYFVPLKNIFLGDNYYNYNLNKSEIKQNLQSLEKITSDAYLYSKPTTQKIICSTHKNKADCWEDNVNNCQWKYKIDGNSYCDVGQNIWP